MSIHPSDRPTIEVLLAEESRLAALQGSSLSQPDRVNFQRVIASLPRTWITDPEDKLGLSRGGWRSFKSVEKIYPNEYASVATCLAIALWNLKRELIALYNMPQGAVIEAKLAFDFWSWPGRLRFGIFDQAGSITRLIATSEVKGQLYDWGKGRRALEQAFGETEGLLRILT
jgi:hypothetical protein